MNNTQPKANCSPVVALPGQCDALEARVHQTRLGVHFLAA